MFSGGAPEVHAPRGIPVLILTSVESDVITLTMVSRGDACVAPTAAVGFTCVNVTNVVLTIQ